MNGDIWVLDGSAFVKLIKVEAESNAMHAWVRERRCVSSALVRTEARRAVASEDAHVRHLCELRLAETHLVEITSSMLDVAGRLPGANLRTLDAIYLACALQIDDDLGGLVSYDTRQIAAADALGITTAAPGASSTD